MTVVWVVWESDTRPAAFERASARPALTPPVVSQCAVDGVRRGWSPVTRRSISPQEAPGDNTTALHIYYRAPKTSARQWHILAPTAAAWEAEAGWVSAAGGTLGDPDEVPFRYYGPTCCTPFHGDVWVAETCDAAVDNEGCVLTRGGVYLPRHAGDRFRSPAAFKAKSPRHFRGTLVNLAAQFSEWYYHWLMEAVPKLMYALPYLDRSEPLWFNVKAPEAEFKHSLLEMLGFTNYTLVDCAAGCSADRVVTTFSARAEILSDDVVRQLRQLLLEAAWGHGAPPAGTRRSLRRGYLEEGDGLTLLIIKRRRKRVLLNHDAVVAALHSRWPRAEVLVFDRSPGMRGTAETFARAHMAMGPHGAGQHNALFMHDGSPYLSIIGKSYPLFFGGYEAAAGLPTWVYGNTTGRYTVRDTGQFVERVETALAHSYGH